MEEKEKVKDLAAQLMGRKGGAARRDALTPEERQKIARKAGKASGKARKKKSQKRT